MYYMRRLYF
uniref:Uncharacterized protein n=1 Tax=Arundo donax TaxID=35708 RepID=A0A0A9BET7_ARUDO